MFDDYAKKLKELGEDVPKAFKKLAFQGSKHYVNTAKKFTDAYKLVDTGAYKRSWQAEVQEFAEEYVILCENSMEYASFLEDGYEIREKHFVPFDKMQGSPKTSKLVSSFKTKYPKAKGFVAKPRRFTGKKIGRQSLNDTRKWILNEFEILLKRLTRKK